MTRQTEPGFPKDKKPQPKRKKSARAVDVADKYFSLLVRLPGYCFNCGKTERLQCAHGFPRTYRNVRWDLRNAWCLCSGCHVFFTHRPVQWDDFMRAELGSLYDVLHDLALHGPKPDVALIGADLKYKYELEISKSAAREAAAMAYE